jgi:hypothetical protein
VATQVAGTPGAIAGGGENSRLVASRDVEALAERLIQVVGD